MKNILITLVAIFMVAGLTACQNGVIGTPNDQMKSGVSAGEGDSQQEEEIGIVEVSTTKSFFDAMPAMDLLMVLKMGDLATTPFIPEGISTLMSQLAGKSLSFGGAGLKGLSLGKDIIDMNSNFIVVGVKAIYADKDLLKMLGIEEDEEVDQEEAEENSGIEGGIVIYNAVTEQMADQIYQSAMSLAGADRRKGSIETEGFSLREIEIKTCDDDETDCTPISLWVGMLNKTTVVAGFGPQLDEFLADYKNGVEGDLVSSRLWEIFQTNPSHCSICTAATIPLADKLNEVLADKEQYQDFYDNFWKIFIGKADALPSDSSIQASLSFGGSIGFNLKAFLIANQTSDPAIELSFKLSDYLTRSVDVPTIINMMNDDGDSEVVQ